MSLPFETATALVRDVIRGAMRTGFRGVVVCNAPLVEGAVIAATEASGGSSLEAVRKAAEELYG